MTDMPRREFLSAGGLSLAGAALGKTSVGADVPTQAAPEVEALVFDTFGTVVDWRASIIREGQLLGRMHALDVDWADFADRWRNGYGPAMERYAAQHHIDLSERIAKEPKPVCAPLRFGPRAVATSPMMPKGIARCWPRSTASSRSSARTSPAISSSPKSGPTGRAATAPRRFKKRDRTRSVSAGATTIITPSAAADGTSSI